MLRGALIHNISVNPETHVCYVSVHNIHACYIYGQLQDYSHLLTVPSDHDFIDMNIMPCARHVMHHDTPTSCQ